MVTVVGWGQEGGTEYWIAKNSWSTWWGEDGYVRVNRAARGGCNFASYIYTCAVEKSPVAAVGDPSPTSGLLVQSYPNPFNPRTTIHFEVPAAGRVRLEVHDVRGTLVRVLVDADLPAGSHQAVWDGTDASGRAASSCAYFARLSSGGRVETARMGLVR